MEADGAHLSPLHTSQSAHPSWNSWLPLLHHLVFLQTREKDGPHPSCSDGTGLQECLQELFNMVVTVSQVDSLGYWANPPGGQAWGWQVAAAVHPSPPPQHPTPSWAPSVLAEWSGHQPSHCPGCLSHHSSRGKQPVITTGGSLVGTLSPRLERPSSWSHRRSLLGAFRCPPDELRQPLRPPSRGRAAAAAPRLRHRSLLLHLSCRCRGRIWMYVLQKFTTSFICR